MVKDGERLVMTESGVMTLGEFYLADFSARNDRPAKPSPPVGESTDMVKIEQLKSPVRINLAEYNQTAGVAPR